MMERMHVLRFKVLAGGWPAAAFAQFSLLEPLPESRERLREKLMECMERGEPENAFEVKTRRGGVVEVRLPAGIYRVRVFTDDVWEDWIGDEFREAVFAVGLAEDMELRPIRLERGWGKPVKLGAFLPWEWIPPPPAPKDQSGEGRGRGRRLALYLIPWAGRETVAAVAWFWRLLSFEGEEELKGRLSGGEAGLRRMLHRLLEEGDRRRREDPDKDWVFDPDSIRPALLPPGVYLVEVSPIEEGLRKAVFVVCLTEDMVLDIRLEEGGGRKPVRLGVFYSPYLFTPPIRPLRLRREGGG